MGKVIDILGIYTGHGKSLDGSWDPGTVYDANKDGKITKLETEAGLMLPITRVAVKHLTWSGFKCLTDEDNEFNMTKSIQISNSNKAGIHFSLHCDWAKAKSGTLPIHHPNSKEGKRLANCVNIRVMKDMNMPTRGLSARSDLADLNNTDMPAVIFECGSISKDLSKFAQANKYGLAIAKGICDYYKVPCVEMKVKAKCQLLVRKSSSLTSTKLRTLKKGTICRIVEVSKDGKRGRLYTGGWITITSKFVEKL